MLGNRVPGQSPDASLHRAIGRDAADAEAADAERAAENTSCEYGPVWRAGRNGDGRG